MGLLASINTYSKVFIFILIIQGLFLLSGCIKDRYHGTIDFSKHPWLKGKKIFVDPGHGGLGDKDRFRHGPCGITEEAINLTVGLVLEDMLKKAGAVVKMSRCRDTDVSLDDRVDMAAAFGPDILLSLHHNGTARRSDDVNYPSVLFWGTRDIKPASYDFACILLDEFHAIMDARGSVLSDFSVFHETGTRILRKTAQLCPGVIGEAGFFSHEGQAVLLNDDLYLEKEAEAYFRALSKYFQWGLPTAEVIFSCPFVKDGLLYNEINHTSPNIDIRVISGNENKAIIDKSLKVTFDNIPVKVKKIDTDLFRVQYGKELYPGGHLLRFSFKNQRHQNSMVLKAPFCVTIHQGDRDRLVKEGTILVKKYRTAREGLKMLTAALSMSMTDPDAGTILTGIIRGFTIIGEPGIASYFKQKLVRFYPRDRAAMPYRTSAERCSGYRFPVEFHGRPAPIRSTAEVTTQRAGI